MSVFKRGTLHWFEFVFNGRRIQRSTKQSNRRVAIDIESAFRTSLAKGEVGIVAPKKESRTVGDLLAAVEDRYRLEGKLSSQNVSLLSRVRRDLGSQLVTKLTREDVAGYICRCRAEGAAPATVNRRLQLLHRCYTVADLPAPKMELFELDNARSGFFTPAEMAAGLANLPDDGLRDFVRFAYATGMRLKELRSLRWENLQDGTLKLEAKDAKTRTARTVPVNSDDELAGIIERRKASRMIRNSDGSITASAYIFHRGDGLPVGQFRKSWKTACRLAGLKGRLFHDLRRSAVRNMVRAGVVERVAMEISGHKTRSVFERYNIVNEEDKANALRATEAYRREKEKAIAAI